MFLHYVWMLLLFIFLRDVRGQTDMFELHDKERGKMDLHVTKDKVDVCGYSHFSRQLTLLTRHYCKSISMSF